MNILSMENVSKGFTEKILFQNVSFGIKDRDRIGVVGINGVGKSTFLKLICRNIKPDTGSVIGMSGLIIQCLSQNPEFNESITVIEHILNGEHPLIKIIKAYENTMHQLSKNPNDENLQKKLAEHTIGMDESDAWKLEAHAKSILSKLGIPDSRLKIKDLSVGQRKRIALAEALIHPSELLILDEPTNHIDLETIKWLEDYLSQLKSALILVTHDRYFLNRVVNRIIEIDKGKLYSYDGNFEYFLEKKTLREETQNLIEEKRRRLYINELAWIRRGAKARTTKQKARIKRFEGIKAAKTETARVQLEIPAAYRRLGKKVIEFDRVSRSFDGKNVIKNFSIIINPGDRIGIVGPNGAGKTVLLNLIAGLITPDSGEISIGDTVKIAYYRQNNEDMDSSIRMIDYIKQTAEYVETSNGTTISASQMLERLLFDTNQQYSLIKNLSGGERRRLMLAKVLMEKPNVLLLDEPTNDLDIQTLEVLEEYLEYFQGVVIVASHDRYFLDKTTDKLLAIKNGGRIEAYNDVDAYLCSLLYEDEKIKPHYKTGNRSSGASQKIKFTFAESKEFSQIDNVIEKLESAIAKLSDEMNKNWSDYIKLRELAAQQKALQAELAEKMERWVYLHELAELIEQQKKI
ncbi:MAG: ABC-F family ATP-binding cassette domain-containing protein [Actinobacteria bacterium]|nr:ABC-F family ATP-binding cassette domain-containing protein [Actinomycetota bacterium]